MHGTNQLRPRESKPGYLQVQDIWPTIQGEGPFSGMPAIFVRLTGCHLACTFCDTKWDDGKDPYIEVDDVYTRIHEINYPGNRPKGFDHKLVVLTGGEPCRQDLGELIADLTEGGSDSYIVQIETAGTFWQDCLTNPKVTIVCSPKTKVVHPKIMEHCDHWKYVIQSELVSGKDGLPIGVIQTLPKNDVQGFLDRTGSPARPPQRDGVTVWLSPCNEYDPVKDEQNLRAVRDSCMKHGYRAMVQLHKYLEVP